MTQAARLRDLRLRKSGMDRLISIVWFLFANQGLRRVTIG